MDMAADGAMARQDKWLHLPARQITPPRPDPMCTNANGRVWMDADVKKPTLAVDKVGFR